MSRGPGISGLMANKRAVLPGLGIKIVPLLLRLFPRGFILAAVGRFQLRKRWIGRTTACSWPAICFRDLNSNEINHCLAMIPA